MAPRRVKNASFTVRADPGPRLFVIFFGAVFENGAVFFVMLGVHVGFVPAFEAIEPFHDRMIRRGNRGSKCPGAMPLELGTDQFNAGGRILKAKRSAMEWNEALAARHVVEQSFLLFG